MRSEFSERTLAVCSRSSLSLLSLVLPPGETLEEISEIVERINVTLKKKKEKLAPQIKELRSVRTDFEAIESVYRTKKTQYENISLGFESERLKLEQDVAGHVAGIQEEESQYHFLHCLQGVHQARAEQVAKEEKQPGFYKDLYEKAIAEQEALTKSLRNEKNELTKKHEDRSSNRTIFASLRGLLVKKLEITKNPNGGAGAAQGQQGMGGGQQGQYGGGGQQSYGGKQQQYGGGGGGGGNNSYLDQLAEESDRMVFDN
jgi:intraflagellar transport protein 81